MIKKLPKKHKQSEKVSSGSSLKTVKTAKKKKFFKLSKKQSVAHKPLNKSLFSKIKRKFFKILYLLSKIIFLFLAVLSVPVIYFIIFISVEPRSFPYLNNYIQTEIATSTGFETTKFNSTIGFDYSKGGFLINIDEIKLKSEKNYIKFSEVSFIIDFYKLLVGRIKISSAIIHEPEIIINLQEIEREANLSGINDDEDKVVVATNLIIDFLANTNFKIKTLVLDGGIINIKRTNTANTTKTKSVFIYIDEIELKTWKYTGKKNISLKIDISFDKNYKNINADLKCSLDKKRKLACNVNSNNINIDAFEKLASYAPEISYYSNNINGIFDVEAELEASKKNGVEKTTFKISSDRGNFNLDKFFSQKIDFQNLSGVITTQNNFQNIKIESLATNFDETKFGMSMEIKPNDRLNITDILLSFNANNVHINNLDKLWPSFLNQNGVRDYVINHIHDGIVTSAYANMFMEYDKLKKESKLISIDSKINFKGSRINYAEHFPEVTDVDGIARFTKQKMSIIILEGRVLGSILTNGKVEIPNFHTDMKSVVITADVQGSLRDAFDHIDYKNRSGDAFYDFINGYSNSDIRISVPIRKDLAFKHTLIAVTSNVKNANTVNLLNNSEVSLSFLKNANSEKASVKIDLLKAEFVIPFIGLYEAKNVEKYLNFGLDFRNLEQDIIEIPYIELKGNNIDVVATASIDLKTKSLKSFNTQNIKYNKSNYGINYGDSLKANEKYLIITGDTIDLSSKISIKKPKVKKKDGEKTDLKNKKKTDILIKFDQIILKNDKKITDFKIDGNCRGFACEKLSISGKTAPDKRIFGYIKFKKITRSGSIVSKFSLTTQDTGYILSGLGASDTMIGGSFRTEGTIKIGEIFAIDGSFTLEDKIEIRRLKKAKITVSEEIKKEKSSGIDKVNDILFSDKKIEFTKAKGNFKLKDNNLHLDNIILNSSDLGVGVTSGGDINLATGKVDIKGLIIPAYALNSLFGIGEVPLIGNLIVGEKGGGLFAPIYHFKKKNFDDKGEFTISKVSAVTPGIARNVFDFINVFDKHSFFRSLGNGNDEEEQKKKVEEIRKLEEQNADIEEEREVVIEETTIDDSHKEDEKRKGLFKFLK